MQSSQTRSKIQTPQEEKQLHTERILFMQGIRLTYGYDFSLYAENSMKRRIDAVVKRAGARGPLEVLERAMKQRTYFDSILPDLTVSTSEMFRDPIFFKVLREKVIPVLKTYPRLTLWSAGCGNGEEVYSLAILLEEEGLLDRSTLFATDINPRALKSAREGIFSSAQMQLNTRNYFESGGRRALNDYYSSDYGLVKMNNDLMRSPVFSEHNLATDHSFTEAHLIFCRNVLMYFNPSLHERSLNLISSSMARGAYLALGSHEGLGSEPIKELFQVCDERWKLFRLKAAASRVRGSNEPGN